MGERPSGCGPYNVEDRIPCAGYSTTKSRSAPPSASVRWTVASSMHHPCRLCGPGHHGQRTSGATSWDSLRVRATGMMPIAVSCLRIGRAFHHQAGLQTHHLLATALGRRGSHRVRQHGGLSKAAGWAVLLRCNGCRSHHTRQHRHLAAQPATVSSKVATSASAVSMVAPTADRTPTSTAPATPSATGSRGVSFLAYEGQTFQVNKPLPLAANAPAGTRTQLPGQIKTALPPLQQRQRTGQELRRRTIVM